MVAAFDFCLPRHGRRRPVDRHRHARPRRPPPTSTTSTPTAASPSPPRPTASSSPRTIFGDRVVWVPWRRPGFQLGLDIAAIHDANPEAVGVILGGHGITAWGATSDEAEANSLWIIEHGRRPTSTPTATRAVRRRRRRTAARCPPAERRAKAAALAPHLRAIASRDHRMVGHFTDSDVVLEFLAGEKLERSPARHVVPRPLPPHQGQAAGARPPADAPVDECVARLRAPRAVPGRLRRLLRAPRHAGLAADARRRPGHRARAGRRHVLLRQGQADRPGRRRVLRQRHQRDARRRGALDLRPDRRAREVPHRVLGARGGQAPAAARSRSATPVASRSSPARPAASARRSPTRLAADGACVVVADLDVDAGGGGRRRARQRRRRRRRAGRRHRRRRRSRPRSTPRCSPSAGSTWS